jgi:hypothetical protein
MEKLKKGYFPNRGISRADVEGRGAVPPWIMGIPPGKNSRRPKPHTAAKIGGFILVI